MPVKIRVWQQNAEFFAAVAAYGLTSCVLNAKSPQLSSTLSPTPSTVIVD
jgi:hypothetical protein